MRTDRYNTDPGMTYDEIGKALGITKQRAQQLEAQALRKIRAYLRARPNKAADLLSFLEGTPDPLGYSKHNSTEGNCDFYENSD